MLHSSFRFTSTKDSQNCFDRLRLVAPTRKPTLVAVKLAPNLQTFTEKDQPMMLLRWRLVGLPRQMWGLPMMTMYNRAK
jgi:hypothetical protein